VRGIIKAKLLLLAGVCAIIIHIVWIAFAIPTGEAEVRWIMSCFDDRFFVREFVLVDAIEI
jgi:hypothetical protein